jgi:hypothetical protein
MPWLPGYRRTASEYRYIPGEPGAGGILPHYKLCDEANPLASYSGAYAPRSAFDQVKLLNERDWSLDCDLSSTRECAPGHYAVLAGWDAPGGLKTLLECLACGSGGAAPGGLVETCTCSPGTANLALLAEDPEIGDGLTLMKGRARGSFKGQITQQCVDCMNDVAWLHTTERRIRQEALACPGSAAAGSEHLMDFHRCGGAREYVSGKTFGCASCAAGVANASEAVLDGEELCPPADVGGNVRRIAPRDIPLENRTGCFFCPPGTHIAVLQVSLCALFCVMSPILIHFLWCRARMCPAIKCTAAFPAPTAFFSRKWDNATVSPSARRARPASVWRWTCTISTIA